MFQNALILSVTSDASTRTFSSIRSRPNCASKLKVFGGGIETENHAGLLLDDPGAGAGVGRNGRVGGEVAGAEILGERRSDQRFEVLPA